MAEVEEPPAKRARNGENGGEADESNITMEDIFGEGINQSGLEKVSDRKQEGITTSSI